MRKPLSLLISGDKQIVCTLADKQYVCPGGTNICHTIERGKGTNIFTASWEGGNKHLVVVVAVARRLLLLLLLLVVVVVPNNQFKTHLFFSIFGWGEPFSAWILVRRVAQTSKLSGEAI